MTIKLGVVMDPIASINYKKDSTLAMLLEAQQRGYALYYFELTDLFLRDGKAYGRAKSLEVFADPKKWFSMSDAGIIALDHLDIILMRKDPPFNSEYIYSTYVLEQAEQRGVLVVNKPQALRDANEKIYTAWFPQCTPATLVTRSIKLLREFFQEQQDIVCKPVDGMGGVSIFHLTPDDVNAVVIFETLTKRETEFVMAQKFVPEITAGDKRIILIDGDPIPYALARIPAKGEWRGNLAAGARGVAQPLTERDRFICGEVGPTLKKKGLYFVGIDVIGDYLTEINVTSPTCIRELDEQCNLNISGQLFDSLEKYAKK
ncbi:MAG: glutathione synthase [Pseudomonadota bacterium]